MWNEKSIRKLWFKVITELRESHPLWMKALKDNEYKAIVVDRKANYYGQCDYRAKTVCINLHLHRHSQEDEVVDTMKHEIAHAIDKCVNGRSSGHGAPWKKISESIGSVAKSTKGCARKVEYAYVMCLHDKKNIRFIKGYNRKPSGKPVNRYLKDLWLKNDKEGSKGKLIIYNWKTWCIHCDMLGKSYFREDHKL